MTLEDAAASLVIADADASRHDPVAVRAAAGRWQRFADLLARRPDASMEQLTQQALARGAEQGASF